MKKAKSYVKQSIWFWRWVFCAFYRDHCIARASSLTFSSLLAMVPFIAIVFSVLSISPFFQQSSVELKSFIFNNFVPSTGITIEKYMTVFLNQASHLPVYGFVFLIITALMMLVTLENTLNAIWKVRFRRQLTGSILLYWSMLTLGPLLIGLSLLFSSYLASAGWLHGLHLEGLRRLLWLLPFVCAVLAFGFLYMAVPHSPVKWNHALAGAVVAAILFEVAKQLFGFYIVYFPTYKLLYGALATIPLFLLWVYFSWLIFLLGAQVVNGLRFSQAERSSQTTPYFLIAYQILTRLYAAQAHGQTLNFETLIRLEKNTCVSELKAVIAKLISTKLVYASENGKYLLNCDIHNLSLHDLYLKLGYFIPEDITAFANTPANTNLAKILATVSQQNTKTLQVKLSDMLC